MRACNDLRYMCIYLPIVYAIYINLIQFAELNCLGFFYNRAEVVGGGRGRGGYGAGAPVNFMIGSWLNV